MSPSGDSKLGTAGPMESLVAGSLPERRARSSSERGLGVHLVVSEIASWLRRPRTACKTKLGSR
eukprot:1632411-Pyramimonas_sp.AAC.1